MKKQIKKTASAKPAPPCSPQWTPDILKTNDGSQETRRFDHPNREADFPALHLLQEKHPLRPTSFTVAKNPRCAGMTFRDYVLPIHKNREYMSRWQKIGNATATPSHNVDWNEKQGMFSSPVASGLDLTYH